MKLFKKLIILMITLTFLLMNVPHKAAAAISVSASSAILMEQDSGRVLYGKEANTKRRIASITKIMTAILAVESDKLDEMVKVSGNAIRAEGSSIYLQEGEKIKLEDLVYGLMLRSGNDAAVAIAEHIGGSLEGFVFLMNQKAEEIGMINTHFENPHGLDDHENHHSTAYDMAILTRYAMENEMYQKISGTKVHKAPNPNESWDRVWNNKNRLLTQLYDHTTGGKTGYTKRAKRTLVTTAEKDGLELIAVTLNGPDDWNDHIQMYETAFKTYESVKVLSEGIIKETDEKQYKNKIYLKSDYNYPVTAEEKENFKVEYQLTKPKENWGNPENIPDVVGKAIVYLNNEQIKTMPIYYEKEEELEEKTFFDKFRSLFSFIVGVKQDG
ncbi:D-alanyl-D-alanine carboxypeptidase family protein [Cytobacillus gottheilii]|uniref:D-alanyl-D-alanine carboxypeptidase family protein n=1 Tax=Cytobacillus gottheilii TaxID=859144 RepID=UPI0009BB7F65|nr:D-alanyl-D-alanine carboxypeptidase family protein [Cytobacillus gottheilii]